MTHDQKRKKKLAERQRRFAKLGHVSRIAGLDRDRVAEVVHRAVCAATGTDGFYIATLARM